tara:strand:+ start:108 stop:572 length:465 start_codon:yes stop_codon:yes gene_type:complete
MTVKQLRDICRSKRIRGYSGIRKDELIALIKNGIKRERRIKRERDRLEREEKHAHEMNRRGFVHIMYPRARWRRQDNDMRYLYVVETIDDDYYRTVSDMVIFNDLAAAKKYKCAADKTIEDHQSIELNIVKYVHSDATENITVPTDPRKIDTWG